MKNCLLGKMRFLMKKIGLLRDYEVIVTGQFMQQLNNAIYELIHENDEFSQEFLDKMTRMENEDFLDIDDLDSLFD